MLSVVSLLTLATMSLFTDQYPSLTNLTNDNDTILTPFLPSQEDDFLLMSNRNFSLNEQDIEGNKSIETEYKIPAECQGQLKQNTTTESLCNLLEDAETKQNISDLNQVNVGDKGVVELSENVTLLNLNNSISISDNENVEVVVDDNQGIMSASRAIIETQIQSNHQQEQQQQPNDVEINGLIDGRNISNQINRNNLVMFTGDSSNSTNQISKENESEIGRKQYSSYNVVNQVKHKSEVDLQVTNQEPVENTNFMTGGDIINEKLSKKLSHVDTNLPIAALLTNSNKIANNRKSFFTKDLKPRMDKRTFPLSKNQSLGTDSSDLNTDRSMLKKHLDYKEKLDSSSASTSTLSEFYREQQITTAANTHISQSALDLFNTSSTEHWSATSASITPSYPLRGNKEISKEHLQPIWESTLRTPILDNYTTEDETNTESSLRKIPITINISNDSLSFTTPFEAPFLNKNQSFGTIRYLNESRRRPTGSIINLKSRLNDSSYSTIQTLLNNSTPLSATTEFSREVDSYILTLTPSSIVNVDLEDIALVNSSDNALTKMIQQEIPWPVKKEAVVEGDLVLGGLMMVHEREDTITCGPVMPQGGIQALEAMLYTLDRLNFAQEPLLPNITIGAHILDDCDKDTYGLEMAVDFIKVTNSKKFHFDHRKHYYFNNYKYLDDNTFDLSSYQTDLPESTHHKLRHHHDNQEIPWPVKKEAIVEGDIVLGGLMMVHEREDTVTCGPVMPQGGIQALEAMLYTLDRLNYDPNPLLPNISLGAHILDDCDKDTYGLEMAVDFIKGSISNIDGAEYHCNKTQVRKVISGVVGAASSVTSIQVANLLRLFKIPQVSFFSTSPELSNKQRFEFFTRTIPSDHYQVKAMVDIVRLMGWSYISIIYEESNYGIKAFEELEDLLAEHNICIAVKEKLVKDSGVADESAYDNIVQKLLTKPRAKGCIIFGSDQEVAGVMRAVRRSNATGSFSWIGSDGWSARSLVSDGNEAEVEGTLSVQPQANPVQGFEEYFLSLNVENNRRNPWFVEFWEHHFQCRYPNSTKTPYNRKHAPQCTGKEKLTRNNTVFEDQLQFVSDAVMAFAYAIRDMHKDLCHGRPGLCDAMKPTKGTELLKYLRKVDFEGLSGDRFHFDNNGDGPARYNIIHFKQVSPGKYRWIRVGEYVEGELRLNMSEIQFKLGHPKPPESVCSFPCDLGQAKKYVEGESCCWHCFNCTQYQIRHPTDPTQCIPCRQGTVPDPHHVECRDIPEEYLRPDSGWAIGAMALSSTGILITMFVCGVFIRHNDTPVVRASGRELSYVLLAGILMCYSVTYALVLRPNDIVCGIQRFGAGFCFTVVYAALLTKTNRISRIFNAGKHSAKRPSFISPRSQLIICSGLVGVQILINAVWMVISPAKAIYHYPTREDNLLVCDSYIDASYMIAFTYPIFLIVICTVYAVLTRKIPEAFNESKHIGFTMYTTCVIWLAFVPLYFGTANHVALRITSMSVTISLSASVTVACLFSPKLYIILIRPERNVRQSMMPMRYSAINKSSATTGSSSMMAAVMVTAATCDQKQQIQKHVPPVEEDSNSESKVKPQMKDISTQTTPNSSNNMLNNSQEHLPKMNNNCNVGNGPIGILPGVQIKDFTL